jgi:exopolysaccharide biosynthesis predicted pyruvyltransferase EpsI
MDQFVRSAQEQIDRMLRPLVPLDAPLLLLDYPNFPNVGDSAIWVGEIEWLKRVGARIAYASDFLTFSERQARRRLDGGTILLHGGGNLGDIWPDHQLFRERVIEAFPESKIVQLPQTVHFRDPTAIERVRRVFESHPDLTLLARDERSEDLLTREFPSATVRLCPDMAFMIGPLERRPPTTPILWLSRTDYETTGGDVPDEPDVVRADWLQEGLSERPWQALRWATHVGGRRILNHPDRFGWLSRPLASAFGPLARQRVRAGAALLSKGEAVVTDRLHGHILSILLGIPHVLIAEAHGKLEGFRETWTSDHPLTHWAQTPEEALEKARGLAGG